MHTDGLITVLMPAYNAARYIASAVESILAQTYPRFELLIIDDGSTDQTRDVLSRYNDSRIRVLAREKRGLGATLHEGVALANGMYVARMDADDECIPERLQVQKRHLDNNAGCGMVHSWVDMVNASGSVISRKVGKRIDPVGTKWQLIWKNSVFHSTAMIKTDVLQQHGINYDKDLRSSEDFDLWNRLARVTSIECIPRALVRYRVHDESFTDKNETDFHFDYFVRVLKRNFDRYGVELGEEQIAELAVISENTKVDPRAYRYACLEKDLLRIYHDLHRAFCKYHGIEGRELDRIQGEQFLTWSRYMLNTSRSVAKEFLLTGLRKNSSIFLHRFFWLVFADVYAHLKLRPV